MNNAYMFLIRASIILHDALVAYGAGDQSALATILHYVSPDHKYLTLTPQGNLDVLPLLPQIPPGEGIGKK